MKPHHRSVLIVIVSMVIIVASRFVLAVTGLLPFD